MYKNIYILYNFKYMIKDYKKLFMLYTLFLNKNNIAMEKESNLYFQEFSEEIDSQDSSGLSQEFSHSSLNDALMLNISLDESGLAHQRDYNQKKIRSRYELKKQLKHEYIESQVENIKKKFLDIKEKIKIIVEKSQLNEIEKKNLKLFMQLIEEVKKIIKDSDYDEKITDPIQVNLITFIENKENFLKILNKENFHFTTSKIFEITNLKLKSDKIKEFINIINDEDFLNILNYEELKKRLQSEVSNTKNRLNMNSIFNKFFKIITTQDIEAENVFFPMKNFFTFIKDHSQINTFQKNNLQLLINFIDFIRLKHQTTSNLFPINYFNGTDKNLILNILNIVETEGCQKIFEYIHKLYPNDPEKFFFITSVLKSLHQKNIQNTLNTIEDKDIPKIFQLIEKMSEFKDRTEKTFMTYLRTNNFYIVKSEILPSVLELIDLIKDKEKQDRAMKNFIITLNKSKNIFNTEFEKDNLNKIFEFIKNIKNADNRDELIENLFLSMQNVHDISILEDKKLNILLDSSPNITTMNELINLIRKNDFLEILENKNFKILVNVIIKKENKNILIKNLIEMISINKKIKIIFNNTYIADIIDRLKEQNTDELIKELIGVMDDNKVLEMLEKKNSKNLKQEELKEELKNFHDNKFTEVNKKIEQEPVEKNKIINNTSVNNKKFKEEKSHEDNLKTKTFKEENNLIDNSSLEDKFTEVYKLITKIKCEAVQKNQLISSVVINKEYFSKNNQIDNLIEKLQEINNMENKDEKINELNIETINNIKNKKLS
jgi:hypothetical protein